MQDTLYPLDSMDVEAIGRSRANREIPKNTKIWMYVGLVVFVVGLFYAYGVNATLGIVIMVVGIIVLWMYMSVVDKKRKFVMRRLKREWLEMQCSEKKGKEEIAKGGF